MKKDENLNKVLETNDDNNGPEMNIDNSEIKDNSNEKQTEPTIEEKIVELEDKLARTFAEMENQRRRFEKEKEEAYEYGGFAFAKEALNLLDN